MYQKYFIQFAKVDEQKITKIVLCDEDQSKEYSEDTLNYIRNIQESMINIEIYFGYGLQELVEKNISKRQSEQIMQNANKFFKVLKEYDLISNIQGLSFTNKDFLINYENDFITLLQEMPNLQTLTIVSEKQYSLSQFNSLLQAISIKATKINCISFNFIVNQDGTKLQKFNNIEHLQTLSLSSINSQEQLRIFQLGSSVKQIILNFNKQSTILVSETLQAIVSSKNDIEMLDITIDNPKVVNKESFKLIENLTNLKKLKIIGQIELEQKYLDLRKLKYLNQLVLHSCSLLKYVSEISSHPNLEIISLTSLEEKNSSKLRDQVNLKGFTNLKKFTVHFKRQSSNIDQPVIKYLKAISTIAHQLVYLEIDFSNNNYLYNKMMSDKLLNSLGDLFKCCNQDVELHLNTYLCQFDDLKRFDLALQFLKIKNIEHFYLNKINLYNEIVDLIQRRGGGIFELQMYQQKNPYYLSVMSQHEKLRETCIQWELSYSNTFSYIKARHQPIFEPLKNMSIPFQYSSLNKEYLKTLLSQIKQFISNDLRQLRTNAYMKLEQVKQFICTFQNLRFLSFQILETDGFYDISMDQFLQACKRYLHFEINFVRITEMNIIKFNQLFDLKGFILDIKIDFYENFENIDALFHRVLNPNNIIFFNICNQQYLSDDQKDAAQCLNQYCKIIKQQILSLNLFKSKSIEHLEINPIMVYLDLFID